MADFERLLTRRYGVPDSHRITVAESKGVSLDDSALRAAAAQLESIAAETDAALLAAVADGRLAGPRLDAVNNVIRSMEQVWLEADGLPERPWFRNLYAATDPTSGYASWMLPLLRHWVEEGDQQGVNAALAVYTARLGQLQEMLAAVRALAG